MNIGNLFKSSLGKKFIMAVTGMLMFFFVVGHLAGNLQVFAGPEMINRYGAFLQGNLELLWPARIALLVILALHVWAAIELSYENKQARPQPYAQQDLVVASYASRTMIWSGLIVLAFIIYHLLHFTFVFKAINLTGVGFADLKDAEGRHDIFAMMVLGFRQPVVAIFYIFAIFLLFLHLSHGVSAMFQSLGWKSAPYQQIIANFAVMASWVIFIGYISMPICILVFGYGQTYLTSRGLLPP